MSIRNQQRRGFASSHPFIDQQRAANSKSSFKQAWLSDPSTYPIFLTIGFALSLCAGIITYTLTSSPDVSISPTKRGSIIRSS
ncbi:MAG: hypothetical protein ACI8RD_012821 [Bacillariaceae sp.]|jgi:hypothetical protein